MLTVTGVQTCALPILIRAALADAAARLGVSLSPSAVELERPRDPAHGDVATNLALTLAKSLRQKPRTVAERLLATLQLPDRKSTRLNSSHSQISYAVFC